MVEGVSARKKVVSWEVAQMAATQRAPPMRAAPMGAKAGEDATSPRVKSTIPATRMAADAV